MMMMMSMTELQKPNLQTKVDPKKSASIATDILIGKSANSKIVRIFFVCLLMRLQ